MIYLLLALLIVEFIISYNIFNKDLFSPSAILCEVFILSTLACIYNIDNWGVDLDITTVKTIVLGNLIFILTSLVIHLYYKMKNHKIKKNIEEKKLEFIKIGNFKLFILVFAFLIFSGIYIYINKANVSNLNIEATSSAAINIYRKQLVEGLVKLPSWLSKLNVIFNIGIFVLIYIFINNMLVDRKKKSNYVILFCILLYLFASVFSAQRTTILLAFIFTMYITYELLNVKYKIISKLNIKYIVIGLLVVILFLSGFALTRSLFGRNDERTPIDNITYYMGNSIESLDLYIKDPLQPKQFGEELFRQFRITLSKYGLCDETTMETPHLEFRRDAKGNSAGNVYTAYRNYLHDFNYKYIIIFQIIIAIFYGIWYERIRQRQNIKKIDLSLIMYSWMLLCLFRFSLTNSFFTFLSYLIFTHWYTFLIWKLFLNSNIKYGTKKV